MDVWVCDISKMTTCKWILTHNRMTQILATLKYTFYVITPIHKIFK